MKLNKMITILLVVMLTGCSNISTNKESQYADASKWVYEEIEEANKEEM